MSCVSETIENRRYDQLPRAKCNDSDRKRGKDRTLAENWRPISLINVLLGNSISHEK